MAHLRPDRGKSRAAIRRPAREDLPASLLQAFRTRQPCRDGGERWNRRIARQGSAGDLRAVPSFLQRPESGAARTVTSRARDPETLSARRARSPELPARERAQCALAATRNRTKCRFVAAQSWLRQLSPLL